MFTRVKEAVVFLKNPERTSINLRWRLQIHLFLLLFIFFGIIIIFIIVFDVFSPHRKLQLALELQTQRFDHRLESYFSDTAAQGIYFSQQVAKDIEKILSERNLTIKDLADNQSLIAKVESHTYNLMYDSLRIADCSGAFIILDTTVNTKIPNASHSRSGTYLKLVNVNTPKSVTPTVVWARGVHEIAHNNRLIFHNKWQLEFDVSRIPFYNSIIANASRNLIDCYYYSAAFPLHGTWEKIMLLCVPIVGRKGEVFGVCGFEINSIIFKLLHAEPGSPYPRITGLVAQKEGEAILLETGLEFGTKEGYYAGLDKGILTAKPKGDLNLYRLSGKDGSETREFIGLETEVTMSPLSNKQTIASWITVCMIPMEDYDSAVHFNYLKFASFCITFFAIAIMLTYYISRRYNLPILRGIAAFKNGSVEKTYIDEIDDLLEFMARSDTITDVDTSSFFEFRDNVKKLSRAETAVFNLYMEGLSADDIAQKLFVSINTIKSHNKNIYRKLNVTSRKELLVYAQMMIAVEE
ncbi:LuxR C-terminal-related transcriptional regulator [Desulfovibrio sp. OttesenSCG-928-C14]|nr:LuxR C-terminal-related transcriptional regulator [Desulfovibrio sp. OttesenSCG-928-C14]